MRVLQLCNNFLTLLPTEIIQTSIRRETLYMHLRTLATYE